jgi:excisionase family DNA binding protein
MDTTTHPLTLTVEQAAKVLGISRSTAYELVHTGDIPSLRLGRRIVIPTARLADKLGLDLCHEGLRDGGDPSVAAATQHEGPGGGRTRHQQPQRLF